VSILVISALPPLLGADGGAWRIASAIQHCNEHHDFGCGSRLDFSRKQEVSVLIALADHAKSFQYQELIF
jgi:hypothetical protein